MVTGTSEPSLKHHQRNYFPPIIIVGPNYLYKYYPFYHRHQKRYSCRPLLLLSHTYKQDGNLETLLEESLWVFFGPLQLATTKEGAIFIIFLRPYFETLEDQSVHNYSSNNQDHQTFSWLLGTLKYFCEGWTLFCAQIAI